MHCKAYDYIFHMSEQIQYVAQTQMFFIIMFQGVLFKMDEKCA